MTEIKAKKVIFKNRDGEHLIPYVGDTAIENRITNCLLEVPQNIKLELADGVLTLKAGSKVIVPNGFETNGTTPKFDVITITRDITRTESTNGLGLLCYNPAGSIGYQPLSNTYSGNTAPSSYGFWYDTANNFLYYSSTANVRSLPFAIVTISNGAISNIDQVFNGMGYIGSTIWVDKGVKGLIPNGRNEDGTLINAEFMTSKIFTYTFATSLNFPDLLPCLYMDFPNNSSIIFNGEVQGLDYITLPQIGGKQPTSGWWYDVQNNQWKYNGIISRWIPIANCDVISGVVSNFKPKQPFRAIDYNDFANTPHITQTYVNGASWYRIYSDGWCEQGGNGGNGAGIVTLLKAFINTNYNITGNATSSGSTSVFGMNVKSKTKSSFEYYNANGDFMWRACGYIA